MANGTKIFEMIAAHDFNGTWFAIKVPDEYKDSFDGTALEDNGLRNENDLPTECGVYRLKCELFWDDGVQFMFENTDPEWDITVKSYEPLWVESSNTVRV